MLAAIYMRRGPARDVLTVVNLPDPVAGPGEVRVRIAASGVNPSDVRRRAAPIGPCETAIIPHSAGAGIIELIGEGVPAHRVGERVWLYNAQFGRPFGTAAELCTVPAANAVPLPAGTSFEEGACLGIPGLTASHAILLAGELEGRTLLIQGGAGAVGLYAIQFAKAAGARVVASVSSAAKAAAARAAGADETIDYRATGLPAAVARLTEGRGVDVVLEVNLAANGRSYPAILAEHGKAVVYGFGSESASLPIELLLRNVALEFVGMYRLTAAQRAAAIEAVDRRLRDGSLRHHIAGRYPLEAIVDAHEAVERGEGIGATLLTLGL